MVSIRQWDRELKAVASTGRSAALDVAAVAKRDPELGKVLDEQQRHIGALRRAVQKLVQHNRHGPNWAEGADAKGELANQEVFSFVLAHSGYGKEGAVDATDQYTYTYNHGAGYVIGRWMEISRGHEKAKTDYPKNGTSWGIWRVLSNTAYSTTFQIDDAFEQANGVATIIGWSPRAIPVDYDRASEGVDSIPYGPQQYQADAPSSSTPVTLQDHGSLGGLGDDDHTIYVLADGTRNFSGQETFEAGLKSDTVDEETAAAGVTIDGVLIKDGAVDGVDVSAHDHSGAGQGGTVDHGNLTGLSDDDHSAVYVNFAGTRTKITNAAAQPAATVGQMFIEAASGNYRSFHGNGSKLLGYEFCLTWNYTGTPAGNVNFDHHVLTIADNRDFILPTDCTITMMVIRSHDSTTPSSSSGVEIYIDNVSSHTENWSGASVVNTNTNVDLNVNAGSGIRCRYVYDAVGTNAQDPQVALWIRWRT